MLFTSGQIPLDPKTGEIIGTDISSQSERVLKNLQAIVETAGATLQSVIKTTCFLTSMDNFAKFNLVYKKYFDRGNGIMPARSCVAVKELPKSVLVEVEAVVAL